MSDWKQRLKGRRLNALQLFEMRMENGIIALFEDENGNYVPPESEKEEWEKLTREGGALRGK